MSSRPSIFNQWHFPAYVLWIFIYSFYHSRRKCSWSVSFGKHSKWFLQLSSYFLYQESSLLINHLLRGLTKAQNPRGLLWKGKISKYEISHRQAVPLFHDWTKEHLVGYLLTVFLGFTEQAFRVETKNVTEPWEVLVLHSSTSIGNLKFL